MAVAATLRPKDVVEQMNCCEQPSKTTPILEPADLSFVGNGQPKKLDPRDLLKRDLWADLMNQPILSLPPSLDSPSRKVQASCHTRSISALATSSARPPEDLNPCIVIIGIQKGTGLANMDMVGASDPYVLFEWKGETFKTAVQQDTLNPKWKEYFEIAYDPANDPPLLILRLWDEDVATSHDPMGQVELRLKKSTCHNRAMKLKVGGKGGKGHLFCSLQRKPEVALCESTASTKLGAPTRSSSRVPSGSTSGTRTSTEIGEDVTPTTRAPALESQTLVSKDNGDGKKGAVSTPQGANQGTKPTTSSLDSPKAKPTQPPKTPKGGAAKATPKCSPKATAASTPAGSPKGSPNITPAKSAAEPNRSPSLISSASFASPKKGTAKSPAAKKGEAKPARIVESKGKAAASKGAGKRAAAEKK